MGAALMMNKVNGAWANLAYASLKLLAPWFADMVMSVNQLVEWTNKPLC